MADPRPAEVGQRPTPLQQAMATAVLSALQADGLTQKVLAIRSGLTEKHVSRVLTCQDEGSFDTWHKFARALGRPWNISLVWPTKEADRV